MRVIFSRPSVLPDILVVGRSVPLNNVDFTITPLWRENPQYTAVVEGWGGRENKPYLLSLPELPCGCLLAQQGEVFLESCYLRNMSTWMAHSVCDVGDVEGL